MIKKQKIIYVLIVTITYLVIFYSTTFNSYAEIEVSSNNNEEKTSYTENNDTDKMVINKKLLAEKYKNNAQVLTSEEKLLRKQKVKDVLTKRITENISSENIDLLLEEIGVFKLEDIPDKEIANSMSVPNDIYLEKPSVYYDSIAKQWGVYTSGYWRNTNYDGFWGNVGGRDGYGITYYNTSGTYSASVESSWATIYDQNGNNSVISWNPSHGDGKLGVAFELQDTRPSFGSPLYVGAKFDCAIWYSASWSSFNGYARTLYSHTWNSIYIESISFSVSGKQFGCDVKLSNTTYGYTCFNTADKVF